MWPCLLFTYVWAICCIFVVCLVFFFHYKILVFCCMYLVDWRICVIFYILLGVLILLQRKVSSANPYCCGSTVFRLRFYNGFNPGLQDNLRIDRSQSQDFLTGHENSARKEYFFEGYFFLNIFSRIVTLSGKFVARYICLHRWSICYDAFWWWWQLSSLRHAVLQPWFGICCDSVSNEINHLSMLNFSQMLNQCCFLIIFPVLLYIVWHALES